MAELALTMEQMAQVYGYLLMTGKARLLRIEIQSNPGWDSYTINMEIAGGNEEVFEAFAGIRQGTIYIVEEFLRGKSDTPPQTRNDLSGVRSGVNAPGFRGPVS